MFNSAGNTFGGFGQNNNSNNNNATPSQSTQNTFGGFGNTVNNTVQGFGQSPQGNTGSNTFGGFGNTATSQQTNSPAFGGFGQSSQQRGSFGFGTANSSGTPTFGSGGTGLFGTPSASSATPAFGTQSSTGLFNSNNTTNAFGGNVFSPSNVNNSTNTNGTSNPPFSVQIEKEGAGGSGTNHFQSITCMPAYAGSSFEELRVQDYNQNRRYANASATFNSGGFGSSNVTGAFGSSNTASAFASQPQPSSFGISSSSNAPTFGQNSSTQQGAFGSNQGATSSAFNTPANGLFGSNNAPNTSGPFGSNPSGNTMFGNSSAAASTPFAQATTAPFGVTQNSSSPFSSGNPTNPFSSTSNTVSKPFSFGSAQGSNNSFAQPAGNANVFGPTTSNTANMPSTTNFFGQAAASTNPNGLFGQASNGPSTNSGFTFGGNSTQIGAGASGNPGNAGSSGFNFGGTGTSGTTTSSTTKPFTFGTPASNATGGFNTQQNTAMSKPFSFGATSTAAQSTTNSNPFGQANSTAAPGNNGTMFGSTPSNSLFSTDHNSSSQALAPTTNLFSKPTTGMGGGLFGGSNQAQSGQSLFGNAPNHNQPISGGFTLGNSNFGGSLNSMNGNGSSQLNYGQPGQQSIETNPYGSNPLFSSVQTQSVGQSLGPIATPLVSSAAKKKPATLPHFKSSSQSPISSSRLFNSKKSNLPNSNLDVANRKSQFSIFDEDLLLHPNAFSPRTNIKRLVIDRKTSQDNFLSGELDLEAKEFGPPKVGETTRLPRNARNTEIAEQASVAQSAGAKSDIVTKKVPAGDSLSSGAPENDSIESVKGEEATAHIKIVPDDAYWTSPAISTLLDYSKSQLSKVKDFKVGRRGYGQISFMAPVDLSTFEMIEDVAGKIVVFDHKMCTVYPEENLKPSIGKGLNVAATLTLEHCYPLSKDKREPIKNSEHPRFLQHVDRLRRMLGTTFVDYLADSGTWIFKVDHF